MNRKPNVLITNDDGVHAPGIRHLYEALKDLAQITVIAPAIDQSATGLSITLRSPLMIQKLNWGNHYSIYSVSGTPADCVKMGLSVIMETPPDLVLSGINRGSNAGRNLLYSGTVAGAMEACLYGIPSVAFSCHDFYEPDFITAQPHIPGIVEHVLKHPLPKGTLLNVNFPSKDHAGIKGYKMTRQGKEYWREDPSERSHPAEKHSYYWLGAKLAQFEEHEDSDITWLRKGFVTAAPIHVDELTDHNHLSSRKSDFEKIFQTT